MFLLQLFILDIIGNGVTKKEEYFTHRHLYEDHMPSYRHNLFKIISSLKPDYLCLSMGLRCLHLSRLWNENAGALIDWNHFKSLE